MNDKEQLNGTITTTTKEVTTKYTNTISVYHDRYMDDIIWYLPQRKKQRI